MQLTKSAVTAFLLFSATLALPSKSNFGDADVALAPRSNPTEDLALEVPRDVRFDSRTYRVRRKPIPACRRNIDGGKARRDDEDPAVILKCLPSYDGGKIRRGSTGEVEKLANCVQCHNFQARDDA